MSFPISPPLIGGGRAPSLAGGIPTDWLKCTGILGGRTTLFPDPEY